MSNKLPICVLLNTSGTRRYVYLKYGHIDEKEYVEEMVQLSITCLNALYTYGAKYIFTPITVSNEDREKNNTSTLRVKMIGRAISTYSELYKRYNIKIHVVGDDYMDLKSLKDIASTHNSTLLSEDNNHLVLFCNIYTEHSYRKLFEIQQKQHTMDLNTIKKEWYSSLPNDIPDISLRIGFGKPSYGHDLYPFLMNRETIHEYFYQTLGYPSENDIKQICDDYNNVRITWIEDKSQRYGQQSDYSWWNSTSLPVLGLGKRIGPFWIPKSQ